MKRKKPHGKEADLVKARDPQVSCYHRAGYSFRFESKALAWFVQFAIRADLHDSASTMVDDDDPAHVLTGYPNLRRQPDVLRGLIRTKHVIDEADLETVGLTLYDFPTLSHFYTNPQSQRFVREATTRDIQDVLERVKRQVAASKYAAYLPQEEADFEGSLVGSVRGMTPHQVLRATQEDAEAQLNERLFVVDMNAPVTLLKKQFTEAIEKVEKSKNSFDALVGDWEEFAVLPYIDLQDWCSANQIPLPSHGVQAVLYYINYESGRYGQKSVGKFTRPHAERMLETAGAAFNALKIAASAEFTHTIEYARNGGSGGESQAAEEALVRWFPRTYPDNLTDLKNVGRLLPGNMGAIDLALKALSTGLAKDGERLSVAERIRQRPKTSEGNMLRIMERIHRSKD